MRRTSRMCAGGVLTILLAFRPTAEASTCPWSGDEARAAEATRAAVTIGAREYRVRGKKERAQFVETLESCDATHAIIPFESWRRYRRGVNYAVASALLLPYGAPVATGVAVGLALASADKKAAFLQSLQAPNDPS